VSEHAPEAAELEHLDDRVAALVDRTLSLAHEKDRDDLVGRLSAETIRTGGSGVTIVVAGEAKRGKSSLVNALLARPGLSPDDAAAVVESPVDAIVATSAHIVIQYSPTPYVRVYHDGSPLGEDVTPDSLPNWVTAAGNPKNAKRVRSAEIGLDHPLLAHGVTLVDTPGVGGLETAHADVTLAALSTADVLLFVADASAPLSGPELSFLGRVTDRIGTVLFVLTKIDAYPDADEVIAANRRLLAQTRFRDAPLFAVSSFRKRKADDPASAPSDVRDRLRSLSGFDELESALLAQIVGRTRALRLANVVQLGRIVLDRLAESEHSLLEGARRNSALKEELETARSRLTDLREARRSKGSRADNQFTQLRDDIEAEFDRALEELENRQRRAFRSGSVKLESVPERLDAELNAVVARLNASLAAGVAEIVIELASRLALDGLGSMDFDSAEGPATGTLTRVPAFPTRTTMERVVGSTNGTRGTYVPERLLGGLTAVALGSPLGIAVGVLAGLAVIGVSLVRSGQVRDREEANLLLTEAIAIARREIPPVLHARVRELRTAVEATVEQAIRNRERELTEAIHEHERMAKEDERARALAEAVAVNRRDALTSLRAEADALIEGLAAPLVPARASVG
jgi:Dynamin family